MTNSAEVCRCGPGEKLPTEAIVRPLSILREALKLSLTPDEPPKLQRGAKGSVEVVFKPAIRESLVELLNMSATTIPE